MAEIANIFSSASVCDNVPTSHFIESLGNFRFSRHHNDIEITYYVAGYVSRGLTKKVKCQDCRSLFSNGESISVETESFGASAHELAIGRAFIDAISRGGLIKPSNLIYITCLHAAELYSYIKNHPLLLKDLMAFKNSRALFVESYICKLDEFFYTRKILETACITGHSFKHHSRHLATVMFNLFAKNLTSEYNDIIHRERKRTGTVENDKRDMSHVKKQKLNSSE